MDAASPRDSPTPEPQPGGEDASVADSRRWLRDMGALLALPAMWVDHEPMEIATGLLSVLFGVLQLDGAYARFDDPQDGGRPLETWRPSGPSMPGELRARARSGASPGCRASRRPRSTIRSSAPSGSRASRSRCRGRPDWCSCPPLDASSRRRWRRTCCASPSARRRSRSTPRAASRASRPRGRSRRPRWSVRASSCGRSSTRSDRRSRRSPVGSEDASRLVADADTLRAAPPPARDRRAASATRERADATDVRSSPLALTRREIETLGLLAQGLSNKEIAGVMWLSDRTVERHITSLYRKIGVARRSEATAFALRHGLG